MNHLEIIDIHMHPFVSSKTKIGSYETGNTIDIMVEDMKRSGITKMAGSVLCNEGEATLEYLNFLNQTARDVKQQLGDFYIPGIHVSPCFVQESLEEIERFHQEGGVLIGELKAKDMGWSAYSDKAWDEIFALMAEYDMFLSIHPTTDVDMEELCRKNPKLNIMLAHPGEYERYHRYLDKMRRYEHVYMDITGVGLFRYGMLAEGVNLVGSERIMFGTDYPICNPIMQVAGVDYEKISVQDKENIFYRNAKRVLRLS